MNGYFSSLIQQTGLKPARQSESKDSQQGSDNILVQPSVTPDQPESLEVEEIIEVTAPSGSATPNHHEIAKSVDEGHLKDSAEKAVKRAASYAPEVSEQKKAPSLSDIIIPPKPVQAKERQQAREKTGEHANTETANTEVSPLNKKLEIIVESQRKTRLHAKTRLEEEPMVTEQKMSSETADSHSADSYEQHVFIPQLPESYQKAIKEWLISPTDGSKDELSGREKFKASIKRKQQGYSEAKTS